MAELPKDMDLSISATSEKLEKVSLHGSGLTDRAGNKPMNDNLIMTLPGELRNRIYDLALPNERIVIYRNHPHEPGLLQACKQIRQETLPLYYRENHVEIHLHTNELGDACDWIRGIARKCGRRPFKSFRFSLTADWYSFCSFESLASLYYKTNIELATKKYRTIATRNRRGSTTTTSLFDTRSDRLQEILECAVQLGRKARKERMSQEQFRARLGRFKGRMGINQQLIAELFGTVS